MIIPDEIMDAARDGDTQTVLRFLDEGARVQARSITAAPPWLDPAHVQSAHYSQVELCRELVARGADPNRFGLTTWKWSPRCVRRRYCCRWSGLSNPHSVPGAAWSATPSGQIFQMLVESGADLNARAITSGGVATLFPTAIKVAWFITCARASCILTRKMAGRPFIPCSWRL